MSLTPLLNATPAIQVHAFAAMAALVLGLVLLAGPKGTLPHRFMGFTWAALMLTVAISSFWIHTIKQWNGFSLIHLLSIFTLAMLPIGILAAHRHQVRRHRGTMIGLFAGALLIAGVFTFLPGRIMHDVVFGAGPQDPGAQMR
jgi:uncharacterized membrane protein